MMLMGPRRRISCHMLAAVGLLMALAGPALSNPAETKPPALELVVLGSGGPGALGRKEHHVQRRH
jgi:hypothetical protein